MFKIKTTGLYEIDVQHEFLLGQMTELHGLIKADESKEKLKDALQRLNYYSLTHLAYEEQGMGVLEYPDRYFHWQKHKFFREKMAEISEKILSGAPMVSTDMLIFLKDWFQTHIEIDDASYIRFIEKSQLFPRNQMSGNKFG
jgi:hemerythrin